MEETLRQIAVAMESEKRPAFRDLLGEAALLTLRVAADGLFIALHDAGVTPPPPGVRRRSRRLARFLAKAEIFGLLPTARKEICKP